jgi:hypothetical protein
MEANMMSRWLTVLMLGMLIAVLTVDLVAAAPSP